MYPENNTEVKQNAQLKGLILVCILIVVKITLTVSFNIWLKKKYIKPPQKLCMLTMFYHTSAAGAVLGLSVLIPSNRSLSLMSRTLPEIVCHSKKKRSCINSLKK